MAEQISIASFLKEEDKSQAAGLDQPAHVKNFSGAVDVSHDTWTLAASNIFRSRNPDIGITHAIFPIIKLRVLGIGNTPVPAALPLFYTNYAEFGNSGTSDFIFQAEVGALGGFADRAIPRINGSSNLEAAIRVVNQEYLNLELKFNISASASQTARVFFDLQIRTESIFYPEP